MTIGHFKGPVPAMSDERGVTALEFGLAAPFFMMLLLGAFDLCHTLYVKAVLQGEVDMAARNSSLETAPSSLNSIDTKLRTQIQKINKAAQVTFDRKAYVAYTNVVSKAEPYTETSGDSACNHGETYADLNNNNSWDLDSAQTGLGDANNIVLYTVTITYPRMFPILKAVTGSTVTIKVKTLLRNQPYDAAPAASTRTCP